MRNEAYANKDKNETVFNQDVLRSVKQVEFRPYSRQSMNPTYNWEAGQEFHLINCFPGETTYKVGILLCN